MSVSHWILIEHPQITMPNIEQLCGCCKHSDGNQFLEFDQVCNETRRGHTYFPWTFPIEEVWAWSTLNVLGWMCKHKRVISGETKACLSLHALFKGKHWVIWTLKDAFINTERNVWYTITFWFGSVIFYCARDMNTAVSHGVCAWPWITLYNYNVHDVYAYSRDCSL